MFGLDDKGLIMLIAAIILCLQIILAIVQFLYRFWDKKNTRIIIDSINGTVTEKVKSFDPHLERAKQSHEWIHQMKNQADVKDKAGLPLIYRNTVVEEMQLEMVKLTRTVASTQKYIARNIKEVSTKIDTHGKDCIQQFNTLDKKIHT